jgi:hypothetical protein
VFSVKSAYHLAVQVENRNMAQEGCSSRGDGSRPVFNEVWTANVPAKVKIWLGHTGEQKKEDAGKDGYVSGLRDGR